MMTLDNLRDYQRQAASDIADAWYRVDRVLCHHAVGTGKTTLGSYLVRAWFEAQCWKEYDRPQRVLWAAYTDEQVEQAVERIATFTEREIAVEKAERSIRRDKKWGAPIIVASVQTVMQEDRLGYFGEGEFGLIVWDEAHHCITDGAEPILNRFAGAKMLGLTATPNRSDRVPLGLVFQDAIPSYGLAQAVEDGWLCRLFLHRVQIDSVDWTACLADPEVDEKHLASVIEVEGDAIHAVASSIVKYADGRPTIAYFPSLKASLAVANLLSTRYATHWRTEIVDGGTPANERRQIVEEFRNGRVNCICNVGVFTEGTDLRNASCIVLARNIRSEMLLEQIIGRGMRGGPKDPVPGKTDCVLVDLMGSSKRFKASGVMDLLGGNWEACVREKAVEWIEERSADDRPLDVLALIAEAKARAEELRLEERRRIIAQVKSSIKTVDPFSYFPEAAADTEIDPGWWDHRLADEKQVERLKALKIPPKGLTQTEAAKLIREAGRRASKGLCSYAQIRHLRINGLDESMTLAEASDVMAYLGSKGQFRPGPEQFKRRGMAQKRGAPYRYDELRWNYHVPAGTNAEYRRGDEPWQEIRTKQPGTYTRIERDGEFAVFRKGDAEIRVPRTAYRPTIVGW